MKAYIYTFYEVTLRPNNVVIIANDRAAAEILWKEYISKKAHLDYEDDKKIIPSAAKFRPLSTWTVTEKELIINSIILKP